MAQRLIKIASHTALIAAALISGNVAKAGQDDPPSPHTCDVRQTLYVDDSSVVASLVHRLRTVLQNRGHNIATSVDLKRDGKGLKRDDWVFTADYGDQGVLYGSTGNSLKFPMRADEFKKTPVTESEKNAVIADIPKLEAALAKLAELEKSRVDGKLTAEEKELTLMSFILPAFKSDQELKGQKVTLVQAFGPGRVISYHEKEDSIENGYGNETNSFVAGIQIDATEVKRRILAAIGETANVKLSNVKSNHMGSDIGFAVMILIDKLQGNVVQDSDMYELYSQIALGLPDCATKK